jgi:outer membrane biosynthesis protein TonB
MKRFSLLGIAALAMLVVAGLNSALNADEYDRKTVISISQPLEVPGVVLPPGKYVMRLFNSSSNRHIVQFMNERQNQQLALTFAVAAERVRPAEKTVLTMYEGSQGAPPALRAWYYPGDTIGQEFLYPHRQAALISQRTNQPVPEIETAQSTAPAATPAEPVQNNEAESQPATESPLIARAEPAPEPIPAPEPQQAVPPPPSDNSQSQRTEPETPAAQSDTASTSSDSLPKTASNGPLALLIGSLAIALAFGMRKLKRSRIQ